jgi:hypothetical protein
MQQIPFLGGNIPLASQEIPHIFKKPEIQLLCPQ